MIDIEYLFKNYENENNLFPSFNISNILLTNNTITLTTIGWFLKLDIKNVNLVHDTNISSLIIKDTRFENQIKTTISYTYLFMFSSLVNINMQNILINTGNSGFNSLGIIKIITLN